MNSKIHQRVQPIIGNTCIVARTGYAGILALEFGELYTEKTIRGIDLKRGDWSIRSAYSHWRIEEGLYPIGGSYEEPSHNDNALTKLIGKNVISIEIVEDVGIKIKFEHGLQVRIFGYDKTSEMLSVRGPEKTYAEFSPEKKWEMKSIDEVAEGLVKAEATLSRHSERCFQRWSKIIPQGSIDRHCQDCAYFRPLSGGFYFWDYGVCSCELSAHDGNVVGVESSCESYSNEIEE